MRTSLASALRVALRLGLAGTVLSVTSAAAPPASSGAAALHGPDARAAAVFAYWTPERRRAAVHRDLVVDSRGLGYLKADESLVPYGHDIPALPADNNGTKVWGKRPVAEPAPLDLVGPAVTAMDPAAGAVIGSIYTFAATVTDPDGVKSVSIGIMYPSGQTTSFTASKGTNGTWSKAIQGFSNGTWKWRVVAKDGAKPSNTSATDWVTFTVDTTGGGSGGGTGGGTGGGVTVVGLAEWTAASPVKSAAGRIYFQMPANKSMSRWNGYICSGTVATDTRTGASIIITAAHCVFDDAYKAFARNVLFIPDQAGTTGSATDLNCDNDPMGCWAPTYGVVDQNYTTRVFPDNSPWDYAYYVVPDSGAHTGKAASSDALADATGSLAVSFAAPTLGAETTALGYPGAQDPKFMYCVDALSTYGTDNLWLNGCGLGGGASGGPWSSGGGSGPIISVNSWGWSNGSPGMAGPKLAGTSAQCVFAKAQEANGAATSTGGTIATCP